MLVLTRRDGDQVLIGQAGDVLTGPIVITQVETRRETSRIGIDAPRNIGIVRSELVLTDEQLNAIEGENHAAE